MEDFSQLQQEEQPLPSLPRRKKQDNASTKKSTQRTQVISFLVIVVGVMVLLSMVSYSSPDAMSGDIRFSDLLKIFTNDPLIHQKAETTSNWLGLLGAIISNLLINSTVGFFSFVIPILTLAWGWTTLRNGNIRRMVMFTNYVIILSLLGSSFFGLLRTTGLSEILSSEWHGSIGAFFAAILRQSVGLAGGIILTVSLTIVTLTLAVDLDLHKTSERIQNFFVALGQVFGAKMNAWKEQQVIRAEQREEEKKKAATEISVKRVDQELPIQKIVAQEPEDTVEEEPMIPPKKINSSLTEPPLEIKEGVKEK
ncbi:MAG: DNA translocase FtsK 4TM domain-containing protein, partial [Bacteroidota bacterium]|nr:DNA translocase FtsK 4TM domain-containing protein [Bacteroidota bacterium]